jgi:hypothetical protein
VKTPIEQRRLGICHAISIPIQSATMETLIDSPNDRAKRFSMGVGLAQRHDLRIDFWQTGRDLWESRSGSGMSWRI